MKESQKTKKKLKENIIVRVEDWRTIVYNEERKKGHSVECSYKITIPFWKRKKVIVLEPTYCVDSDPIIALWKFFLRMTLINWSLLIPLSLLLSLSWTVSHTLDKQFIIVMLDYKYIHDKKAYISKGPIFQLERDPNQ